MSWWRWLGPGGIGAVGVDAASLIGNSMMLFEADPEAGAELDEAAFHAFLSGLRGAGWSGNVDDVRLAYAATNALFCGVTSPNILSRLTHPESIV